jgi:hypothetical protein
MARPKKIVAPQDVLMHTAVRMPQWLNDQVELIGRIYPDKKTFTDKLIFVVQQGIEKIVKDREKTTYDRIEAMVARIEDLSLTILANQLLAIPEGEEFSPAEVEEQKTLIEEAMRKRRANRSKRSEGETAG